MQYRLRTLMIVLALGPLIIAIVAWGKVAGVPGIPAVLALLSVVTAWRARESGRSMLAWVAVLWVIGYPVTDVFLTIGGAILFSLIDFKFPDDKAFLEVVVCTLCLIGLVVGSLPALYGSGRPKQTVSSSSE